MKKKKKRKSKKVKVIADIAAAQVQTKKEGAAAESALPEYELLVLAADESFEAGHNRPRGAAAVAAAGKTCGAQPQQ